MDATTMAPVGACESDGAATLRSSDVVLALPAGKARPFDPSAEWLETDGLGGFASGTAGLERTRRYHALLLTARRPPTERFVLVNGAEAEIETDAGRFALSAQRYASPGGDVVHPDGATRIVSFDARPWPTWRFEVPTKRGRAIVAYEIFAAGERTVLTWRIESGAASACLFVRPLMAGRDYHSLMHENDAWRFGAERLAEDALRWQPYDGLPAVVATTNGTYEHAPDWYRGFIYTAERERGLDFREDLASPGVFRFELQSARRAKAAGEDALALLAFATDSAAALGAGDLAALRAGELARRSAAKDPADLAADAYIVRRGQGLTIVAGYPWFTDWGRDTFIALRGLCLAPGRRRDVARDILVEWSSAVSEGMLPNRFPDSGEQAEYNSVDASLWYVVAAGEFLGLAGDAPKDATAAVDPSDAERIRAAILSILDGYWRGTRFSIRADADGLLSCGQPGAQLTWMDAKVGDWVVTPRVGKPVEVQALWLNALAIGAAIDEKWRELFDRGLCAFRRRFWNAEANCLYDVVDCNHLEEIVDAAVRPNQILAVGGLPLCLLGKERARRVVDTVERELATPLGLRSLAPREAGYRGRYEGGVLERDGAYHQGTVWPWLLGPFVEAWVRVRGYDAAALAEARRRFVAPLRAHLGDAGLGHVSEIADADSPHAARGCPFQAWSLGELLRLERSVLAECRDADASLAPLCAAAR